MERTQVLETTPAQINVRGLVCLLTHILSERMVTERVLWWASGAVSWAFRDYVTSCSWADTWCPTDLRTTTPEFERETKPRTSALEEGQESQTVGPISGRKLGKHDSVSSDMLELLTVSHEPRNSAKFRGFCFLGT
jgi:hypothetical protein